MGAWTLDASVGIVCEIAFASGPLDAVPVWTDVSSDLDTSWESFRGKESEFDEIQPGWLNVGLVNSTRKFDPDNAAGPYFGNLKPMKRIRMRVAVGAFSAVLWSGYILGWPQDWGVFRSTANLACIDGSRITAKLPQSAYRKEVLADSPAAYWPLQDGTTDQFVSGLASGGLPLIAQSQFLSTVDLQTTDLTYPIGESYALDLSSAGTFATSSVGMSQQSVTIPAAIEFWARGGTPTTTTDYFLFIGAQTTSTFFGVYVNGAGDISLAYSHAADNLMTPGSILFTNSFGLQGAEMHHVAVYRSGSSLVVMVDGSVRRTLALTAGSFSIGGTPPPIYALQASTAVGNNPGVAISHIAAYNTAPSVAAFERHAKVGRHAFTGSAGGVYGWEYGGARINRALDDAGWPAGDRDIAPGGTLQGAYIPDARPALSYIQDVERSELPGVVFFSRDGKLTFRDRQWLWTRTPAATFKDDGTGIEYTSSNPRGNDVSTIRNVVTVSYNRVGAITVRDATSIADYGEQPTDGETITAPTLALGQDAGNLARFRTRTRGQPGTIFPSLSAEMHPNAATQIPAVMALELGDVVQLVRTPMSQGAQTTKKAMVLGIRHRVTPASWTVELYLSPPILSAADAPYLTLGDATRGKVGSAFGNLVPF